ncbi:flagellar basal body P-ring formation chaperone FlgA [Sulfitobacter sp. LCG007]
MTVLRFALVLAAIGQAAPADIVVPTRTIRANAIVTEGDVTAQPGENPDAFDRPGDVIGQEARVTLFAGRPIRLDEIGPPALVDRNQIVALRFETAGLMITTDGRALERGGVGDMVRIMNLSSRATLFGEIQPDGSVRVHK